MNNKELNKLFDNSGLKNHEIARDLLIPTSMVNTWRKGRKPNTLYTKLILEKFGTYKV